MLRLPALPPPAPCPHSSQLPLASKRRQVVGGLRRQRSASAPLPGTDRPAAPVSKVEVQARAPPMRASHSRTVPSCSVKVGPRAPGSVL